MDWPSTRRLTRPLPAKLWPIACLTCQICALRHHSAITIGRVDSNHCRGCLEYLNLHNLLGLGLQVVCALIRRVQSESLFSMPYQCQTLFCLPDFFVYWGDAGCLRPTQPLLSDNPSIKLEFHRHLFSMISFKFRPRAN
ncbi:hypothetical protein BDZ97DRAFT_737630 [Flammula alnicola]|nr:hypothetical protein BDZ97DRAFT_737630 [Flammula alnicola]